MEDSWSTLRSPNNELILTSGGTDRGSAGRALAWVRSLVPYKPGGVVLACNSSTEVEARRSEVQEHETGWSYIRYCFKYPKAKQWSLGSRVQ